jgi:hypothetical protein
MLGGPKEKEKPVEPQIMASIPQILAERKALREQTREAEDTNRIAAVRILGNAGKAFDDLFTGKYKRA